jgi:hypothetical protein
MLSLPGCRLREASYFDLPEVIAARAPRLVAIFNGANPLGQELTGERACERNPAAPLPCIGTPARHPQY